MSLVNKRDLSLVMQKFLILIFLLMMSKASFSQESYPAFSEDALVQSDSAINWKDGKYQLVVFGAIACAYSRYLVDNFSALDQCEDLEIILLLNDEKEAILSHYPKLIKSYRVYSNTILKHRLRKGNDFTPHSFLFKDQEQLLHIKGVRKKMLLKIKQRIDC